MDEFRRILVPVDFSPASAGAARYAASLAQHFGGQLTIAHVVPDATFRYSMVEPSAEHLRSMRNDRRTHAQEKLEQYLPDLKGPHIRYEILDGDPAEEILRLVDGKEFDVLVISTRGEGKIARLLTIGSVTSKVLHSAACPVITSIQFEDQHSAASIHRVLCAVDLGPQSHRILCWAATFASKFDAQVAVVHAAPLGEAHEHVMDQPIRDIITSRLKERIDSLMGQVGVQGENFLELDPPPRAIAAVARRVNADAIVLGRGVSQDLLGRLRANAYDIIRQAPCPVVSV